MKTQKIAHFAMRRNKNPRTFTTLAFTMPRGMAA
jgi:hypothetical protein